MYYLLRLIFIIDGYKSIDAFVCVSKCVYDAQVIKGKEHKYHLVHNGINTYRFPDIKVEKKRILLLLDMQVELV